MDRINPRPLFRETIQMLENARCPECSRAFDPVGDAEDYCPRIKPLHCSWCATRRQLLSTYRAWQRQDAAAHKAAIRRRKEA